MLYNLDHTVLENRTIKLAIRAVSYNAPLSFRIKGVMTIEKLKSLMKLVDQISDARVYKAVMLLGFFRLFRLATLVPSSQSGFSAARFPTHGDVIWGSPGAHFITKCAKNMQHWVRFKLFSFHTSRTRVYAQCQLTEYELFSAP